MTKALQDAFKEAEKLPEAEQDRLAAAIRAEIEGDSAWESRLAGSQEALGALADQALAEHRTGRTRPLDPDEGLNSRTTQRFRDAFGRLPDRVQRRARAAYRLFRQDPWHPSLRFKLVHPNRPISRRE